MSTRHDDAQRIRTPSVAAGLTVLMALAASSAPQARVHALADFECRAIPVAPGLQEPAAAGLDPAVEQGYLNWAIAHHQIAASASMITVEESDDEAPARQVTLHTIRTRRH